MKTILNPPINDITCFENIELAWKQVKKKKGAPGIDGMKVDKMPIPTSPFWEELGRKIRNREYSPKPAKRVDIPKPDGTQRGLNIPCVVDRVVQASAANYISFMMDEDMSDSSYGFRPERCCEKAIVKCLEYMNDGYDWVVDLDLRKFFDTVDHDRMIRIVDNTFQDSTLTWLVRKFLTAGVMVNGELVKTEKGIPQGGPLSPVLANLYLDQADKEFEKRGLRFARYADDMMILVKSEKAAERVMKSTTRYLEQKLKLEVNATKSKIARPDKIKFLGFTFRKYKGKWEATPHEEAYIKLEEELKEKTKRNWSISLDIRIRKINELIISWCNYFRCACIPKGYLQKLAIKIRRRIRMIIWKQWKRISKREWGLIKLGCPKEKAHSYACARQGYARCASTFLQKYITNNHLKRKGLLFIDEVFLTSQAKFHRTFVRTARCRSACRVV